jgi:DNA-binding response OmpR family regulator
MKRVLIIEGEPAIARLFVEVFRREAWEATACEDVDAALDRLVSVDGYDAVIVGDGVRGKNGVEVVTFIRALEHRKTTAVLMVTSYGDTAEEALAAGADEVLPKPIDNKALVSAAERALCSEK